MTEAIFAVTPSETIKWVLFHFSFNLFPPDSRAYIRWSLIYLEPNSLTMRNDRTHNTKASSTGQLLSSDRKVFLGFTEVSSQWYVNFNQEQYFIHINDFFPFYPSPSFLPFHSR